MLLGFVLFSKNQRSVVCLEAGIDQHDGLSFVFKDRVQYQSVIHDSFAVWDVFLFDLPQDSAVAESIDSLELAINRHEVFRHVGVLSVGGGSRGLSSATTGTCLRSGLRDGILWSCLLVGGGAGYFPTYTSRGESWAVSPSVQDHQSTFAD